MLICVRLAPRMAVLVAALILGTASSAFSFVILSRVDRPCHHITVDCPGRRRRVRLFASKGKVSRRRRRCTVSAKRKRRGSKQCAFPVPTRDPGTTAASVVHPSMAISDDGGHDPDAPERARPSVTRSTSSDAAAEIRSAARASSGGGGGLLVITTDASGGSGRFAGTCAVLRRCGGGSAATDEDSNEGVVGNVADGENDCDSRRRPDGVVIASRRMRSLKSHSGLPPEIAAIGLGCRAALENVEPEDRATVVFVADCERALAFFCSQGRADINAASVDAQEASCRRAMATLVEESTDGVTMCKVRSASRSGQDGFFDHAAADVISAATRNVPNGDSFILASCLTVPPLGHSDLDWLEISEEVSWESLALRKPKGASGINQRAEGRQRLQRCRDRIVDDFGMSQYQFDF